MAFVAFNSFQRLASNKKRAAGGGGTSDLQVISSYTTSTIIPNLSISTYGNPSSWGGGLAVNALQTKMLFLKNNAGGSLYYATSSDQGTTWSAFTLLGTVSNAFSVAMSADGTRAIVARNSTGVSFVNWSGSTPILSQFDSQVKNYTGCNMTNDGQYIVVSADGDTIYYSKWNGTTYDAMKSTGVTGAHWGVCISPLGDKIFYGYAMKCSTATWTGSTATWTAGVATGVTVTSEYGFGFLGGIQTGAPNYVLFNDNNGIIQQTPRPIIRVWIVLSMEVMVYMHLRICHFLAPRLQDKTFIIYKILPTVQQYFKSINLYFHEHNVNVQ